MEISETGVADERISVLEKKVRDMEALVRALINELPDMKTAPLIMTRQSGEYEGAGGPDGQGTGSPEPAYSSAPPVVSAPAGPAMARIMQPDGTMKMEPRFGDLKTTDSSAGYGQNRKGTSARIR